MALDRNTIVDFLNGGATNDEYLVNYIERHNADIGAYTGSFQCLLGLLMCVATLVTSPASFSLARYASYLVLTLASLAMVVISRGYVAGSVSKRLFSNYLVVYLWVLALYGVVNSVEDFMSGGQIVTFIIYAVFANVIFLTPPMGIIMMVCVCYAGMYLLAFSAGRLDVASQVNFWLSGITIIIAGCVRYHECRISANRERALELMGSFDALTGLKNRMALRVDFDGLVKRDQYVAMADLDDFKGVNDTYGHEAGDTVLSTYGRVLKEVFPEGSLYRYGGDEFLLFVPAASVTSMHDGIKEVRRRIATIKIGNDATVHADASIGWVKGIASDITELREQVHHADQMLYEQKAVRKRGRVSLAFEA